jgi:hypothetical protein
MIRFLVALSAAAVVAGATASTASAEIHYGGITVRKGTFAGPAIAIVLRDDNRIVGRVSFSFRCRGNNFPNLALRLTGTSNGQTFTASGKSRPGGVGAVRYRLTGTLTPDAAAGKIRLRSGCGGTTRDFVLRAASAPAGAPALPAPGSLLNGLSGQTAGGVRLPVSLRVAKNGRLYAQWSAVMKCGRATIPMWNYTPPTTVKPDGTFSRSEHFTIRYGDGTSESYRVKFSGRFLADGAVGTLNARMQFHNAGRRYVPCRSGTQAWSARP